MIVPITGSGRAAFVPMLQSSHMKNPWVLFGVIIALLFVGAFYIAGSANEANNEGIQAITHIKGNPDADIVLVEYSDFQCPACRAAHPVVLGVMESYGDSIRFEYRHFPIERAHPYAVQAGTAAEAAGQQGKFYEFHDLLFDNQPEWSQSATPNVLFEQYAEQLELDMDMFRRHTNASVLRDKVRAQQREGLEAGVTGTPTFFLNGQRMTYSTFGEFVEQIEAAIDPSLVEIEQDLDEAVVGETVGEPVRFGI